MQWIGFNIQHDLHLRRIIVRFNTHIINSAFRIFYCCVILRLISFRSVLLSSLINVIQHRGHSCSQGECWACRSRLDKLVEEVTAIRHIILQQRYIHVLGPRRINLGWIKQKMLVYLNILHSYHFWILMYYIYYCISYCFSLLIAIINCNIDR